MSRTRRIDAQIKRQVAKFRRANGRVAILRFAIRSEDVSEWPPLFRFRLPTQPMFFDRQLQPLDWEEYAILHSFHSYCRVDEATLGQLWVSTVWLGHNYEYRSGRPPVVFETMVFSKAQDISTIHPELRAYVDEVVRYCSEGDALMGHAAICMDIRQTIAKIDMADQVWRDALYRKSGDDGNTIEGER